ncbi:hypothetical protein M413DRAFT_443176 [Hebeloma cylindrosporum]|uniref:Uncharacterized protein n=1 Tax=Hebeloma cylindrosporum TaxID=76867 RepID=A0A0C2YT30_HEBCY|nr:hypothetical protein M413DRAFT_443176 [Hebeloma cylindrosporum h7]
MAHPASSLFKSAHPHQPVATLMLVENSRSMSLIWGDLRDQYLGRLVDGVASANQSVPITVSVLESYPCPDSGSNPALPRQYSGPHDGLLEVQFNGNPENRLSAGRINQAIDFLESAKFSGHPAALHLVIVAVTTPTDDDNGMPFSGNGYPPWHFLAQKLAKNDIHCHIVVSPQNDMGSLTLLFEETLRLQENIEESLYLPVDHLRFIVRLSAKPSYQPFPESASSTSYPTQRIDGPRRNSYPLDNFCVETYDDGSGTMHSGDADPSPSLVTQLQQVHGLTKKKVYGAKPARQPFFRDERVRDKYRKAPTPLTMPLPQADPNPSPTAGGRAISQSRVDRMSRVGQASPTDLHARRQYGWPRRGSRLSTPEPENLAWQSSPAAFNDMSPGSSYVSSDLSSPVTPITTMEEIYTLPNPVPSNAPMPLHITPAYQTGGVPEANWNIPPQPQQFVGAYNPTLQTYFPPPDQFYAGNRHPSNEVDIHQPHMQLSSSLPQSLAQGSYDRYNDAGPMTTSPAPPMVPSQAPMMVMSETSGVSNGTMSLPPTTVAPSGMESNYAANPSTRHRKKPPSAEDEERFEFGEDFVAATAALFEEEVLPAYPNYPGMSSGLSTVAIQESLPPSMPASRAGELYATRATKRPTQPTNAQAPPRRGSNQGAHPHNASTYTQTANAGMANRATYAYSNVPNYQPTFGSSLTGWAG